MIVRVENAQLASTGSRLSWDASAMGAARNTAQWASKTTAVNTISLRDGRWLVLALEVLGMERVWNVDGSSHGP
jgi:hypothetical protein